MITGISKHDLYTIQGKTKTVEQHAKDNKISFDALKNRIAKKYPEEELLLPPGHPKMKARQKGHNIVIRRR